MTETPLDHMINLDKETGEIQQALVDFDAGARRNVAVVGDPLSGKTTLVDAVIARYGKQIPKVSLKTITDKIDEIRAAEGREGITAVDDCQYLFTRRINGFTAVEQFLNIAAASDHLYITTWNRFAWNYLEHVFDLRDYFPVKVTMPSLDPETLAAVIGTDYDLGKTRFVDDAKNDGPLVKLERGSVKLNGPEINIPFLKPGTRVTDGVQGRDAAEVRSKVFGKIRELSNGNPGVATAIWKRAYREGEVRTSRIDVPEYDTDLDPDETFVLSNILMMKSATVEELQKITAGQLKMGRILYTLTDRGLIVKKSGRFSVEPLALYDIVHRLKKMRQVW